MSETTYYKHKDGTVRSITGSPRAKIKESQQINEEEYRASLNPTAEDFKGDG